MAKDLVLDVIARKNSRELSLLADEFDKVANQTDDFGKKLNKTTTFSKYLDDQIAKTKVQVKQLGEEFDRTGKKDVFASLKGAEANLKKLENIRKQLSTALGPAPGQKGGLLAGIGGLIAPTAKDLHGIGDYAKLILTNPAALAGVAAAASTLGVMVGGAVITGIGLAGIGAGIAGQLHDPKVNAALEDLKSDLGSGFKNATKSFAAPLAESIGILDKGFKDALPGIADTFKALSPELTGLAHGAVGFLSGITTGLEHVLVASKPLVDNFSRWLPTFGNQLGGVFDEMAKHSKEAEEGLALLEDTISGLTIVAQKSIPVLSEVWNVLHQTNPISWVEHLTGVKESDLHAAGYKTLAQSILDVFNSGSMLDTTLGVQLGYWDRINADLVKAGQNFDKVFGITLSSQQANLQLAQSVTALSDSLQQNGHHWDITTAAGQANRAAVLQEEQAILALRDANIASGNSVDEANGKYLAQQDALRKTLAAAGLTTQQINDLIGAYAQVPDKVSTTVNTPGLGSAQAGVGDLNTKYQQIPDKVETYVNTPGLGSANSALAQYREYLNTIPPFVATTLTLTQRIDRADVNGGGIPRFAAGGRYQAGMPRIVGENGPELDIPDHSGVIVPSRPGYAPMASGGGGATYNITVNAAVGSSPAEIGAQVVEVIRKYEQANSAAWRS